MDDTSDVPAKPAGKRPFLKRGEGVQKRVFGPVIKKQRDVDRDDDASAYGQTPDSVRGRSSDVDRSRGKDQGRDQTPAARPAPRAQPAWREDDSFSAVLEAPVRSSLVTARPGTRRKALSSLQGFPRSPCRHFAPHGLRNASMVCPACRRCGAVSWRTGPRALSSLAAICTPVCATGENPDPSGLAPVHCHQSRSRDD